MKIEKDFEFIFHSEDNDYKPFWIKVKTSESEGYNSASNLFEDLQYYIEELLIDSKLKFEKDYKIKIKLEISNETN